MPDLPVQMGAKASNSLKSLLRNPENKMGLWFPQNSGKKLARQSERLKIPARSVAN